MRTYLFLILGLTLIPSLEQAQPVEERYKAIKAALQAPSFKKLVEHWRSSFPVLINEETCSNYDPDHILYHDTKLIEQKEDQFIDIAQVKLEKDSARIVFNLRISGTIAIVDLKKEGKDWRIVSDHCVDSKFGTTKESLLFEYIQSLKSLDERIKALEK